MNIRPLTLIIALVCLLWRFSSPAATGIASWYGEDHRGRLMANGKPFNPDLMTCASWDYPFGTYLKVTYHKKSVVVKVTDRGPYRKLHRITDLTYAAFKKLENPNEGLIIVTLEKVKPYGHPSKKTRSH